MMSFFHRIAFFQMFLQEPCELVIIIGLNEPTAIHAICIELHLRKPSCPFLSLYLKLLETAPLVPLKAVRTLFFRISLIDGIL